MLEAYRLDDLPSIWAICEDLIFSYPVSKAESLFVCAGAKAAHIDDERHFTLRQAMPRGRSMVLWRAYFVSRNADLSGIAFGWMTVGLILGRLARALRGSGAELGYALGHLQGLGVWLWYGLTRKEIVHALR